ncbi:MAG TPA: hypothetical protein VHC97_15470 [Thermoanaerobaculia bacterium]|jgi:hypothetical protein|nr:hypothetical protein [Thermoanaerobaculia bacterium]
MRSLDDSTLSSSRNAFTPSFLHRIGERDEPVTAGEADVSGPWHVEEIPGRGHGLFRLGESLDRGFEPYAVFRTRTHALLAAALLPGTGRDPAYRLDPEEGKEGYAIRTPEGEALGHCTLFDENLIAALDLGDGLLRSPHCLAGLLEAAGAVALERAGVILDGRVS